MITEYECKFLDINQESLKEKLEAEGAVLIYPEFKMERVCFDFADKSLREKNAWVRVRKEHNKTTVTYKTSTKDSIDGAQELEVEVSDFDQMISIFKKIGMVEKSFQETRREEWVLDGVHIMIDEWPWIPPFVEIEGENEEKIKQTALKLGFDWNNAKFGSVEVVYQNYYKVSKDEINSWEKILFSEIPVWLLEKKI